MRGRDTFLRCRLVPSCNFAPDSVKKHPKLLTTFRAAIRAPGSQWKEEDSEACHGGINMYSLTDCQQFLQKMRCMPNIAGVHATFWDKPVHRAFVPLWATPSETTP